MTRRTPFTHLQLPDPQITTTAVLRGGCDLVYGLMLASLPCLGCLAWIHDQAPSLAPESRSWGFDGYQETSPNFWANNSKAGN